jgi:hypothetical protein
MLINWDLTWPMGNSSHSGWIHILDDDSLLNVFYLYRPSLLGEDENDEARLRGGTRKWVGERWWFKLAHVCQRWRNLIFGTASYLNLSLVCAKGTPVAEMLAHSPPLPLVIDYFDEYYVTEEDEKRRILSLRQRDRVRRIRLHMPVPHLQKFIVAIDEEYPILEYLIIMRWIRDNNTTLVFPETLQAPHLRHLTLSGFSLPIGSRLLTTAVGLVTLGLVVDHPSTYIHPNTLLQWLHFMPKLEALAISFLFAVPNRDVELTHTPITTSVTLPNLHWLRFRGVSAYLEALVHRITAPRLKKLEIGFFYQLPFSVPRLRQFMNTAENLKFDSAKFEFSRRAYVKLYSLEEAEKYAVSLNVDCWCLHSQVSSVARISNSLGQVFSTVDHLILEHGVHSRSPEEHNKVDRTEWRKLLGPFSNVKTLRIAKGLVEELSHCLQINDGELPLGLLPKLQELTYSGSGNIGDAFSSFFVARQSAGHPVALTRC